MKFIKHLTIVYILSFLIIGCSLEDNEDKNPYKQVHIPWPSLADSPWPMFRHDPQGTGRSQYSGPRIGKVKWSKEIPGVLNVQSFTSFTIDSDSVIYFASSDEPGEITSDHWFVYSMNPDNSINWKFWYPDENNGSFREIYTAPLIISDGTLIFGVYGHDGKRGYIYAIDLEGNLIWRFESDSPIKILSLNIDMDGNLYFVNTDGDFITLDSDGGLLWEITSNEEFKAHRNNGVSISPEGDVLYVTGAVRYQTLYAVSKTGSIIWTFNTGASCYVAPVIDNNGNIYFGTTEQYGDTATEYGMYSLDSKGILRWSLTDYGISFIEPTIDSNGNIYFTFHKGVQSDLVSVDNSGNLRWQKTLPGIVTSSLICDSEDTLFLSAGDLLAISADGAIIWQLPIGGSIFGSPAIAIDGTLYLGTDGQQKTVYAIN